LTSPNAIDWPSTDISWRARLKNYVVALDAGPAAQLDALATASARLVDTADRDRVIGLLRELDPTALGQQAGLAYAAGYAAVLQGRAEEGTAWLTTAYALVQSDERALQARVAFELGALYLTRASFSPVEVLVLGTESLFGEQPSPDLLHLRALAASGMGDDRRAEELFRAAIRGNGETLTPATTVLAMINLAASANQHDPDEALALTDLALGLIAANQLHPRMRAAANNVMGYALIALGRLDEARERLELAAVEAIQYDNPRVAGYASFNHAIVDELEGKIAQALERLLKLREECGGSLADLAGWAALRALWLRLLMEWSDADDLALREAELTLRSARYNEAIVCIRSVLAFGRGQLALARSGFDAVRRTAAGRGDVLTEFVMLLQLLRVERAAGRTQRATWLARQVSQLLRPRAFRLSPNWWTGDLVEVFRECGSEPGLASRLVLPASRGSAQSRPSVELRPDGTVRVADIPVSLGWQTGKTGRRVLLRLFLKLLSVWPASVPRDALADQLWPESDGDAAVHNLYAAANDLRKILGDLPGVRLTLGKSGYALLLDENVRGPRGGVD
jgi:tetratricopeptide (TPR) repeat protein